MPPLVLASRAGSLSFSIVVAVLVPACAPASGTVRGREAPFPHLREAADGRPDAHDDRAPATPLPDPASGAQVTLEGILAFADQRSPVLLVARSTRSRADAARVAASPILPGNPELTVAAGRRSGRAGSALELELELLQPIAIAGERGLRHAAADRLGELTEADIEQIRWAVHCDVHAAFHAALVERERARLAERVVAFQEDVLRVVERQIAAGETAPLSQRLAQAEVAQARQVLVAANQGFLASRLRLAQLSGWPVARPPDPAGGVDAPRDPPDPIRLLEVARSQLPRLKVGRAVVREAAARADLATRERWPRPSIGVQLHREGDVAGEGTYDTVMGVVSLTIPSFDTNQGERARARADVTVGKAELEAAERLLDGEIVQARGEVVAAALRTRAYGTEILPRFEENLTLLRRSFELGEIDLLALSVGRERFLRIQSDALDAQLDYFTALAGLERVVGVDLWHDEHHEEPVR